MIRVRALDVEVRAGFRWRSRCSLYRRVVQVPPEHVSGNRSVGGTFLDSVTGVKFTEKDNPLSTDGILLRSDLLKTKYRCPAGKVENKACKSVSKVDVDGLAKK